MTNKRIAFIFWTTALCVIVAWAAVAASPGGEDDPVVTKSYVDQKIVEAMSAANGSGLASGAINSEEVLAQIEYAVRQQVQKEQGATFTPVSVEMNETIYGGEGCEMVLRSGAGFIVTSTDAVVNVTSGADMKNGADVPRGNLLIVSRRDGRGVRATDSSWFLVKGDYLIVKAGNADTLSDWINQ